MMCNNVFRSTPVESPGQNAPGGKHPGSPTSLESHTCGDTYEGMRPMSSVSPDAIQAETITITGHNGDEIEAYRAIPLAAGSRGGVVWIHHMPGYDRETKEFVRRLAVDGYQVVAPNLYSREAPGADPDDAAATVRAAGGVPDSRLVGDVAGAADYLRGLDGANGKIGVIGHCSGGRHSFLAACSLTIDAAVDCYGAFVVEDAPEGMPRAMRPILHLAPDLSCPLLGLFGADDRYRPPNRSPPSTPS
jgi:carboxymethylenebutenolidase